MSDVSRVSLSPEKELLICVKSNEWNGYREYIKAYQTKRERDMKISYQDINTLPAAMRKELSDCAHAGEAKAVFEKWDDRVYVEPRSRGAVWLQS